ncbi:MAG: cupin domain-containing protein [Hansschlegelia sp.]
MAASDEDLMTGRETTAELRFADDGSVPNNPTLSLLLHRGAFDASGAEPAVVAEALFGANGWGGFWRNGVYSFHHYHSTCHEALAVVAGWADLRLGGEGGETVRVSAGDVIVLPAGAGHRREGASADFLVVGAYPPGQPYDMVRADPASHDVSVARIAAVPLPATDPVFGADGGLRARWRAES